MTVTAQTFADVVAPLLAWLDGRAIGPALGAELEAAFAADGAAVAAIEAACETGLNEGWLGEHGSGRRRWGRILEPSPATHGFSVNVVWMDDMAGAHHIHPGGEIVLVLPQDPAARFCGEGKGWVVYPPGSDHIPAVSGGRAIVLYALPGGAITFT